MYNIVRKRSVVLGLSYIAALSACASKPTGKSEVVKPADRFDLTQWSITVPLDADKDGKVDKIDVKQILKFSHPDFFYIDNDGYMVFSTPNRAPTTSGSTNSRSELRQMIRGKNYRIGTKDPGNNFALKAHKNAKKFGSIGGKLDATLKVNHVPRNAKHSNKYPAFSVVVGQVHAGKDKKLLSEKGGYGWGNEPIKIYYKKWPNHEKGSVYWTYERNLAKNDPDRTDIAYAVWGNTWENSEDPGDRGLALGEEFSYTINVYENTMYLTFKTANHETVYHQINLSNNVDANGKVDEKDHPNGYAGEWFYFKAGAYDQCSVKDDPGFWYPACGGTGDWKTDYANGDYASASFSKLVLSDAEKPKKRK